MTNSSNKTFFCNSDMFNIARNINPTELLEFIKCNSPVSIWDISKKLKINRNPLYYLLRNLEFAGLIKTKMKISKQNRSLRMIYYNHKNLKIGEQDETK